MPKRRQSTDGSPGSRSELPGEPLTEVDYLSLEPRWITREIANAANLRRVDSFTGAEVMGRKICASSNYAGVLIPYYLPNATYPHSYRLRRDQPDLEYKGDRVKESAKYLTPYGSRPPRLYFPPSVTPEMLADPQLPLALVEGEFKTLALWRLASYPDTKTLRFLPIGLAGIWAWRGLIGKIEDAAGARRDVHGPIPDLDLITWVDREVYVLFDADTDPDPDEADADTGSDSESR